MLQNNIIWFTLNQITERTCVAGARFAEWILQLYVHSFHKASYVPDNPPDKIRVADTWYKPGTISLLSRRDIIDKHPEM